MLAIMILRYQFLLGGAFALVPAVPVMAQTVVISAADSAQGLEDEIIVQGDRLRGQVVVEQAPVLELNEQDILAIGATSIADLMGAISAQTGSSRGRGNGEPPVMLVNGIRISSFRELRSYPPEAIAKVEVLPEEVAQRFGYPPDRRVVNIILKDKYSSKELELQVETPDRGGYFVNEQEFTWLRIRDGGRFNVNLEANDTSMLTEAERGVIQAEGSQSDVAGDPDPAAYRSLVADGLGLEATVNYAKAVLGSGTSISLNATYERNESRSLSGLNAVLLTDAGGNTAFRTFGADDPLERYVTNDSYSASASLSRPFGGWQMTATSDAVISDSVTRIDRRADSSDLVAAALAGTLAIDGEIPQLADPGQDIARSKIRTSTNKITFSGNLLDLPAGELSTTFDLGFDWNRIESDDTRTTQDSRLSRTRLRGGTNLAIPIAESGGAWGAIGDVTLNLNASVEDLSDFGTLTDWSSGVTWGVARGLTLSATYIVNEEAPSISNLGNPQVETLNVPVFDFVNGETVLATVISGGNPDLLAETQRDWKFSANWELPFWKDARFSAEYIRNRSRNVTGSFPALTAEVEAAFPDRVTRDVDGTLTEINRRPVTFDRTSAERLVFGLVTRGSIGKARSGGEGQARQRRGPPAFGPRGGDGRGRYFLNLTHTIELDNTILIAPGGPLLDLLDGDATSTTPISRHSTGLEGGVFLGVVGGRVSARYSGSARIDGSGTASNGDLHFGDLATFDLRLFADLGQILQKEAGFWKGFRVSFRANNIFDARRRVTDSNGDVPLSYQPSLIDPNGRYLGLELRKMF